MCFRWEASNGLRVVTGSVPSLTSKISAFSHLYLVCFSKEIGIVDLNRTKRFFFVIKEQWSVVGWSVKCSGVLQCFDGLSNKVSNIIRRLVDNMKLLLVCILRVLLSQSFIFFRFYFFINLYMVLFLFDNVIYVFLLLWLCILIVCLCMTTLTEVFPCFFLSCKAMPG